MAVSRLCLLSLTMKRQNPQKNLRQIAMPQNLRKKVKGKLNAVMEALSEMDCFGGEPNTKAKFYIYLQSASWCPPCRKEMPKIVEMCPEMKKAKVEIILIGWDRSKEAAQKYLESFKAPFPGVMMNEGKNLPGFVRSQGIPHATFSTTRDSSSLRPSPVPALSSDGKRSLNKSLKRSIRKQKTSQATKETRLSKASP